MLAGEALPKTILRLQQLGCRVPDLQIAIGPHIQVASFEVGHDVKNEILSTISPIENRHFVEIGAGITKVDLAAVLLSQLEKFHVPTDQIFTSTEDTFQNLEYHSYRRDGARAGRQFSFVALCSRQIRGKI